MPFPGIFKRYFPPRTPCCFVRIHARLGTMPSKCPRRSTTSHGSNVSQIMGAIHSAKISGNFGPKLNGSVRANRKSFKKTGPPFEVDHFSRSDRLENLDEWTAPLNWENYALQILFHSAYFLLLSSYGRRR